MLQNSKNILIIILILILIQLLYYWYHHFTTVKLAREVSQKVNHDIYVLPDFLNNNTFMNIKNKLIKYKNFKRSNNFVRKGSGISNIEIRKQHDTNMILHLLDNPETLKNLYNRTGLNIQFVPKIDKNYISIISYDKPGDFIGWHKDGNIYHGNRWAGILTIINKGEINNKSSGNFIYRIHGVEKKINASENTLILFRGDKIEHKTDPIKDGDRRVVISMLFCDVCYPKSDIISHLYQNIVDFTFYK